MKRIRSCLIRASIILSTMIMGVALDSIVSGSVSAVVTTLFPWIMFGVCIIYGIRLYFNSVIAPTFLPICGAAFCSCISFILITGFKYTESPIKVKIPGVEVEGQAGQIILWCAYYIIITVGLKIMGVARSGVVDYDKTPLHQLWKKPEKSVQATSE